MGGNGDSAIIKPINKAVVHRICSGQVILDLASAVKELVENSLDAGANSIEVRLKEYGGESFEVGDNGYGISPDNYQSATLKYHTSKISDFSDLQSLTFFGFRGEALSSLCALGNVTIETRTKNESVGTQLIFDHSGLIVSQKNIARQIGTTVTVAKLFSPLPVRYKEFHRNVRREYGRLLSLLHAYALIAKGVRFLCTNMTGRGPKSVVLRTQGSGSVKDNIITVFGTKTLACLEPLEFCVSDGCRIEGFVSKPGSGSGRGSGDRQFFYVNGRPVDMPKVTKLLNELYRSYNSQQYPMAVLNFILPTTAYDVNVTPDKRKIFLHDEGLLMSALKESLELLYTPNKYTYVINNFESSSQLGQAHTSLASSGNAEKQEPSCVEDYEVTDDVNIKVDLFSEDNRPNVHSEELFHESKEDIMHDDNPENQKVDDAMTDSVSDTCEPKVKTPHDFAVFKCRSSVSECASPLEHSTASKKIKSYTAKAENSSLAQTTKGGFKVSGLISHLRQVQSKLSGFVIPNNRQHEEGSLLSEEPVLKKSMCGANANATEFVTPNKRQHEEGPLLSEEPVLKKWMFCADENAKHMKKDNIKVPRLGYCSEKDVCSTRNLTLRDEDESCFPALPVESYKDLADDQRETLQVERGQEAGKEDATFENLESISLEDNVDMVASPMQTSDVDRMMKRDEVITYDGSKLMSDTNPDEKDNIARQADSKDITIARFDINRCRLKSSRGLLRCYKNAYLQRKDKGRKRCYAAATLAKGPMVEDVNEKEAALVAAIKELERSFNKEDFKRMKVIGQFNLGFIIAKIDDDLFIIDQHASDEKYNFERLSQTTILNRQPLLCPLSLELSVAEEITISTHMDTFRRNGFDFIEDTSAPPGKRLLLSAVPYSKNITFGVGDIQELVAILVDEPAPSTTQYSGSRSISAICPSRVRAMLASRACRSSVMIGDALSKKSMETIVQHLSTLNSPWNCPHGRPTMRHLIDLSTLYRS